MKKVMIAAAIVCAAAFANAATVNWSFGYIAGPGTDGSGWGDDALSGDVGVQLIIGSSLSEGEIGDTVYSGTSTITFEDGYAFPDGLEIAAMSSDTPYYSQLILTSGDSTLKSGIYGLEASAMDGDTVYPNWGFAGEEISLQTADDATLAGLGSFDDTYGTFGSAGWTGAPGPGPDIPEPTSGLLLAVGGAMLALRRKQK